MEKETLFTALAGTLDANPHTRKASEQQLHDFEKNPGFTAYLLDLIVEENVPLGIQISAAIFFKNRVTHYWIEPEDRAPSLAHIQSFEKKSIKDKIVPILAQVCQSLQLRIQLTTALQKIFHADKWDDIIELIKQLFADSNNPSHIYTGLLVLFEYTQSYRWSTDSSSTNPVFEDITQEVFPQLESILQGLIDNTEDLKISDEMIYLSVKIFKYITYLTLPSVFQQDPAKLGLWCQLHILVINKPLPASVLEEDIQFRAKHPRIKAVKWCFGNLNRLLLRHGGGKSTEKLDSPFAVAFLELFVPEILNVYWSVIEKWSTQKIWISDASLYHMISFLKELISTPRWPLIQEKLEAIITHVVLPTLKATNDTVELYEDDQEEYIRRFFNIFRDSNTADMASVSFVDTLVSKKFNESIDLLLTFINKLMSARAANRNDLESAMNSEGALRILLTISYKLDRKLSPIYGKVDDMLYNYVYPDLGEQTISTMPFLVARACDTIAMFDHKYQNAKILRDIFQAIVACFHRQDHLPIQITAIDALRTLVNEELVAEHISHQAPQLMETLLEMSNKFESDILTSVMEAFVEKFARNLEPYAKDLAANLAGQFIKLAGEVLEQQSGSEEPNPMITDKENQAAGILNTISTLVVAMNTAPQVAASIEPIVERMIRFVLENAMISFIAEVVDILSSLVYSTENVSPVLWSLYQSCIDSFELYALEYFDVFQPFFEATINFGFTRPELTIESPQVQALISVCFKVVKSDYVEPVFAHTAFELLELTVLSLNKGFAPFLDRFLPEIFDVFKGLEAQDAFDGYMLHHLSILRIFFACLFVEPDSTLRFLQQHQFTGGFIQLWLKHSEDFQSVYGCKLQILALLAILVDADLSQFESQPDTVRELADLLVSNLEVLPSAIKKRQDILSKESAYRVEETEGEDDEYNGAYTGLDDLEADEAELEALKETPIDKIHVFEVFANKLAQLQQNRPKYDVIIGDLDDSQMEIIKKIILVNEQQQQKQQQ